jgi:hypothetical protein
MSLVPRSADERAGERSRPGPEPGALRRIGADLRSGRNLEVYLTVLVSLGIAVLSAFGVVNGKVVGAVTLAVLALLSASALASRHQVRELQARTDQLAADLGGDIPASRFLMPRMPPLEDEVATAADIRLVGVTLTRTIRDLLPVLDRRLRHGASVRVLVIDPEGSVSGEALARTRGTVNPDFYLHRLASTIDLLRVLASTSPSEDALQLRVLPYVPTFGMCLLDPGQPDGRIDVEVYQIQTIEHHPCFTLTAARDTPYYELFASQFDTLWNGARPYQLTSS